jgi:EmrB/QacA subfamily drug resistance transporter
LLAAVALGITLAPLNSTMIAVALPDIQDAFGVSVAGTAWLVTIYLAAMAVGNPIGGRLGDQFGRRRVYLFGLVWFGIVSIGCAFAPNLPVLIALRTQQALAGALSFPNGSAMIREAVPLERRGSAFGMIGLSTGLAAASGPPMGGFLVHHFGWASIFWANAPVIAAALFLSWRSLPRTAPKAIARPPFDVLGSAQFAVMLGAIITIPTLVRLDQPLIAVGSGVVALALALIFGRRELRIAAPVVDLRLFRRRAFAAACGSIALSNFVMYTTLLAMPLYLRQVRDRDEQVIGLTLVGLMVFAGLWGPIGGRITDRSGRWLPAVAGAVLLCAGVALLAWRVHTALLWPMVVALGIMGIGLGVSGAPVQTAAVEAVPMSETGAAAGIFSTSRYMGSVVGSTLLAAVFADKPGPGDSGTFVGLFALLTAVALIAIWVNAQIERR